MKAYTILLRFPKKQCMAILSTPDSHVLEIHRQKNGSQKLYSSKISKCQISKLLKFYTVIPIVHGNTNKTH